MLLWSNLLSLQFRILSYPHHVIDGLRNVLVNSPSSYYLDNIQMIKDNLLGKSSHNNHKNTSLLTPKTTFQMTLKSIMLLSDR